MKHETRHKTLGTVPSLCLIALTILVSVFVVPLLS